MANEVTALKMTLGAGARVNKYMLHLSFPQAVPTDYDLQNARILCYGAEIPGKSVGLIESYIQGRKLVTPGDTSYTNNWTLTFYQTEGHELRRQFLSWMRTMDHFQNNEHSGSPTDLMVDVKIAQLDSQNNETAVYTFHNMFPSEMPQIALNGTTDSGIQEFDVVMAFTDWVIGGGEFDDPLVAGKPTLNVVAG